MALPVSQAMTMGDAVLAFRVPSAAAPMTIYLTLPFPFYVAKAMAVRSSTFSAPESYSLVSKQGSASGVLVGSTGGLAGDLDVFPFSDGEISVAAFEALTVSTLGGPGAITPLFVQLVCRRL